MLTSTLRVLIALPLFPLAYQSAGPVRLNPRLNSPYRYRTAMTMEMSGGPMEGTSMDMSITQSWLFDKKTDKGFHLVTKIEDATGSGPLQAELDKAKGTVTELEVDSRGKMVPAKPESGGSGAGNAMAYMHAGLMGAILPELAPSVGLTWTQTMDLADAAPGMGDIFKGADSNLEFHCRVSRIDGRTFWIESNADKTMPLTLPGVGDVTLGLNLEVDSQVDMQDGMLIECKIKGKTKMAGTPMGDMDITQTGTIKRAS